MTRQSEVRLSIGTNGEAASVFGNRDENLKLIAQHYKAKIVARGNEVAISGEAEEVSRAERLFRHLADLAQRGTPITCSTINYAVKATGGEEDQGELVEALSRVIYVTPKGKAIRAKTVGQKLYFEALQNYDIVFAIGPAGTGKTYLAVVQAIISLKNHQVERIVLARPAVEAGEKLGFLPGDLQDKVDPYLRPLYDSLYDVLGVETAQKYLERGLIEVAPLAYMRGRTLESSFIILDEAQNTTREQMKMFLTRIGLHSRAVITGDVTQIDLLPGTVSGLVEAEETLGGIKGLCFHHLTEEDVVRHPLVEQIIKAYAQKTAG